MLVAVVSKGIRLVGTLLLSMFQMIATSTRNPMYARLPVQDPDVDDDRISVGSFSKERAAEELCPRWSLTTVGAYLFSIGALFALLRDQSAQPGKIGFSRPRSSKQLISSHGGYFGHVRDEMNENKNDPTGGRIPATDFRDVAFVIYCPCRPQAVEAGDGTVVFGCKDPLVCARRRHFLENFYRRFSPYVYWMVAHEAGATILDEDELNIMDDYDPITDRHQSVEDFDFRSASEMDSTESDLSSENALFRKIPDTSLQCNVSPDDVATHIHLHFVCTPSLAVRTTHCHDNMQTEVFHHAVVTVSICPWQTTLSIMFPSSFAEEY